MTMTLAELRTLDAAKYPTPTKPLFENPIGTVSSVQVTGKEGFFIIQWSPISKITGYRIAVMTDKELDTPNIGIFTAYGEKSSRYDYLVGNIALTRNFAVQAFRDVDSGPWSAIKSATSSLTTAAGSTEPTNPAPPVSSQPPPPSGGGDPGGGTYCALKGSSILALGGIPYRIEEHESDEWISIYAAGSKKPFLLTATPSHRVYTPKGLKAISQLVAGDVVVTEDGEAPIREIQHQSFAGISMKVEMSQGHLYYANGILSHNTKLL